MQGPEAHKNGVAAGVSQPAWQMHLIPDPKPGPPQGRLRACPIRKSSSGPSDSKIVALAKRPHPPCNARVDARIRAHARRIDMVPPLLLYLVDKFWDAEEWAERLLGFGPKHEGEGEGKGEGKGKGKKE